MVELRREAPLVLAAIVAAGCLGEIAPMVMPLLLGSVIERFAVGDGAAGLFPALEIAGIASGALALSVRARTLDAGVALRLALLLVVAGQLAALLTTSWPAFLLARAVTGIGEGALMASANIQASLSRSPHRVYALLLTTITALFATLALGIPAATAAAGPRGGLAAMLALAVAAAPVLLAFQPRPIPRPAGARGGRVSGDGRRVLLAGVLVYLGFSALWTYSGRIGAAVGLSLAEMGAVVTGCGLLGVVGPLTAGAVGLRWGRTPPLLATLGLVVLAAASAAMAGSCAGVALSLLVAMPAFMAFVTYLRSAMAAIDPTGRLVGLGVGVLTVGAAAGPSLVGLALEAGGSYGMIGWLALACGGAAAALLVPIAKAIDARERPHSHIAPAGTPTPAFAHQTCEEERS